jgi:hypothetical protein
MFRPGGTWKEFGISSRDNYTVFPFWMFAIVWAVVSFALGNMIHIFFASTVLQSTNMGIENVGNNFIHPISSAASANMNNNMNNMGNNMTNNMASNMGSSMGNNMGNNMGNSMTTNVANNMASSMATSVAANTKPPGYYILEMINSEPKYVYWGPEPPSSSNLIFRGTTSG